MVKIENFPLCIGYLCTTLWVKNSLEITLSLTVFEIFTVFHFPLKSKMAAKSGENLNFSARHRILLYYPAYQKFAQIRSISYHFQDIFNDLLSVNIQDGRQKWRKLQVKNLLEITLSLMVFETFTRFHFLLKSKMAPKSGEN